MERLVNVYIGPSCPEFTTKATAIKPGMECTIAHPNDRYAATVKDVAPSGAYVIVERNGERRKFTWRKGRSDVGHFAQPGSWSPTLILGVAEDYLSPDI